MPRAKPTWQQATALVSLSTCGAMTGFAFAHGTVDEMTSPTRMPVKLMAMDDPARPAKPAQTGDSALRSAIVKVARNYLRMAQSKSPAEMQALIWGVASSDGADHGESCAAFASLTLALGAQATGQQSWVTGGTTYPWPLRQWADVRVDPNPDSPQIISVMQDAQAHHRWHPLGDGYQPQPGDWVLFDGHVEVVTSYSPGALRTIGGDSAPNLSVNAHTFTGSLAAQGVAGFVNNGQLLSAVSSGNGTSGGSAAGRSADAETAGIVAPGRAGEGSAAVPGTALTAVNGQGASGDERCDQDGGHRRPGAGPGADAGHDGRCRHPGRQHRHRHRRAPARRGGTGGAGTGGAGDGQCAGAPAMAHHRHRKYPRRGGVPGEARIPRRSSASHAKQAAQPRQVPGRGQPRTRHRGHPGP